MLRNCDVRFVSGHEFTRAEESLEKFQGFSPCKALAGAKAPILSILHFRHG